MSDFGESGHIEHVEARIAERLAEQQPRIGLYRPLEVLGIVGRDECRLDTEALECVREQVVRAAIERTRSDDVAAGVHQRGNGEVQRRLARCCCDTPHSSFQGGESFL